MSGQITLRDLETKGYLVVPAFFSGPELEALRADFAQGPPPSAFPHGFKLIGRRALREVGPTIDAFAERVRGSTTIHVDLLTYLTFSHYIITERTERTAFWHQDFDVDYRLTRDHVDYLNFYVPIAKPDPMRSNVAVIPFDALERQSAEGFAKIHGGGGHRFVTAGGKTQVFGNYGEVLGEDADAPLFELDFDLDALAVVPPLAAGDLLLMRGDLVHRTQDASTARTSASIRLTSSRKKITRERIPTLRGERDPLAPLVTSIQACFDALGRAEITLGDLEAFSAGKKPL